MKADLGEVVAYSSAVGFYRCCVLLVVRHQCAREGCYYGAGWDVSQARTKFQCLALSGASGQRMGRDLVARQNECRHCRNWFRRSMVFLLRPRRDVNVSTASKRG